MFVVDSISALWGKQDVGSEAANRFSGGLFGDMEPLLPKDGSFVSEENGMKSDTDRQIAGLLLAKFLQEDQSF